MLKAKAPWNLKEVLAVHAMRLLLGFILVRFIFPSLFVASQPIVEVTDRVVMVALVWLVVHKHGGNLRDWGLSSRHLGRNIAAGLGTGIVLLIVSIFSERVYTTLFLLAPSQHPLVVQVENAVSWRDLALPLFLAGLAAPVAEEVLYRLFTFPALKERFGLWGGVIGSAAIFALFHFNAYWLADLIIVGAGLALLYYLTGSLVSAIIAHSFINTTKMLLIFFNIPLT
jgi:membrane protease YdiL (CAAX protease family)